MTSGHVLGSYTAYSTGLDYRFNYKQDNNVFGDNFLYYYEPLGVSFNGFLLSQRQLAFV